MRTLVALLWMFGVAVSAIAQPKTTLTFEIIGEPVVAASNPAGCDTHGAPDAPARALHLADGSVQFYATDQVNQLLTGPDLLHLRYECGVVFVGGSNDDPAAFDDRSWLATPRTADGRTIWAVVHDEFHGELRKPLCPTGKYMDCWYNALTLAVSTDGGRHFARAAPPNLVATLPYRYDEVGLGHHGYFNPSNIVSRDGHLFMFAFATKSGAQAAGNCLLRSDAVGVASAWRAWDGTEFGVRFIDPYREPDPPDRHVCAPVSAASLRWPVTSLVRHRTSGLYIATMQNTAPGGGVYMSTSSDLLQWSSPVALMAASGLASWRCAEPAPIAYPSLLDANSADRNFESVGNDGELFATRFIIEDCRRRRRRELVRWRVRIFSDHKSRNLAIP